MCFCIRLGYSLSLPGSVQSSSSDPGQTALAMFGLPMCAALSVYSC